MELKDIISNYRITSEYVTRIRSMELKELIKLLDRCRLSQLRIRSMELKEDFISMRLGRMRYPAVNPFNGIERGSLGGCGGGLSSRFPNPFNGIERNYTLRATRLYAQYGIRSMELKGGILISRHPLSHLHYESVQWN